MMMSAFEYDREFKQNGKSATYYSINVKVRMEM